MVEKRYMVMGNRFKELGLAVCKLAQQHIEQYGTLPPREGAILRIIMEIGAKAVANGVTAEDSEKQVALLQQIHEELQAAKQRADKAERELAALQKSHGDFMRIFSEIASALGMVTWQAPADIVAETKRLARNLRSAHDELALLKIKDVPALSEEEIKAIDDDDEPEPSDYDRKWGVLRATVGNRGSFKYQGDLYKVFNFKDEVVWARKGGGPLDPVVKLYFADIVTGAEVING